MNDKITLLRDELEKQIITNEPYSAIYKTSVRLDKLLVSYYKDKIFNLGQTG